MFRFQNRKSLLSQRASLLLAKTMCRPTALLSRLAAITLSLPIQIILPSHSKVKSPVINRTVIILLSLLCRLFREIVAKAQLQRGRS